MGEVYKGFDGTRTAAVKILARELVDEEMVQRFAREAQTINALHHPRIVKAYSYGEIDGVHYLALEYIDGDDLRTLLKRQGRFALEEVRTIASGVADALEAAHAQGIVHRDIKPSNIMLRRTSEGSSEAVLMDFGVAKLSEASTLTGDKAIGTIDYMSPEQIRAAQGVDRRADIYGLAVVCYELLTGERLYSGSVAQVLFAHLQQPPPDPRSRVPDLPASVANALLRALAKDPNDRFQSVSEFATALNS
jgi:serine/threonine-protein kinase